MYFPAWGLHGVHLGPTGPRWAPMLAPWSLLSGLFLFVFSCFIYISSWFYIQFNEAWWVFIEQITSDTHVHVVTKWLHVALWYHQGTQNGANQDKTVNSCRCRYCRCSWYLPDLSFPGGNHYKWPISRIWPVGIYLMWTKNGMKLVFIKTSNVWRKILLFYFRAVKQTQTRHWTLRSCKT